MDLSYWCNFHLSSSDRDMSWNVWNRPSGSLWSIWGSHQTLWSLPLPNVTWHSGTWPYTMTPSIDQTLHQLANLLPNWTLIPILTLLPNFGGFHRTLQRVRLANRGRLLLRTPGPVPFGTCICSYVETILSWTCHVYGPFEFRTSLGTSILLFIKYHTVCNEEIIIYIPPRSISAAGRHARRSANWRCYRLRVWRCHRGIVAALAQRTLMFDQ